jgi:hypothetical protein
VSTPRREEVEHRVEYGGALIRAAEVGADTLGPIGTRFRYVAEVAERGQLPTAHTDAEREGYKDASGGESLERRVYAVVGEEPVCVAVEGDGEWDFVKEVP